MSELIVIGYGSPEKAAEVRRKVLELQAEYLVRVGDAVIATKGEDGKVSLDQLFSTTTAGAAGGGMWGALIGLIFLHPLLGAAVGAAAGAISGALTDVGIDDDFMTRVAEVLQPGQAALFLLADRVTNDRFLAGLAPFGGTVIRTNLSGAEEAKLRAALGASTVAPPAIASAA